MSSRESFLDSDILFASGAFMLVVFQGKCAAGNKGARPKTDKHECDHQEPGTQRQLRRDFCYSCLIARVAEE